MAGRHGAPRITLRDAVGSIRPVSGLVSGPWPWPARLPGCWHPVALRGLLLIHRCGGSAGIAPCWRPPASQFHPAQSGLAGHL